MSSIAKALGNNSPKYKELKLLPSKELKGSRNIALIVLDGLGYKYLKSKMKGTIFENNLKGSMTSVFPATTATAIPTFRTGVAPQQHALTGWYMHLKELGVVTAILHATPRMGGFPLSAYGIDFKKIMPTPGFSKKLKAKSFVVTHKFITDSDFNRAVSEKSKIVGYTTLKGMFRQLKKVIESDNRKKYIYTYWPMFDSLAHQYGVDSEEIDQHFEEICKALTSFIKNMKKTKTTVIVIADHGLIDTTEKTRIAIEDHPKLKECLTIPLCGEGRAVYCYVHPSKTKYFENYVRTKLKKACTLHKSEALIKKGYFGLFKPSPLLADRIGDYVLIMKENYVLKDALLDNEIYFHPGYHGGTSPEEMLVPLVVFKV